MREVDLKLADGRTLHTYDTGEADRPLTVFYHHGTPNLGEPPRPLFADGDRLGIRWVGYDRPGYGRSTPNPGRDIASAAADAADVADALGIDRFAVMGHSGGTMHALACGALLRNRVSSALCVASLAPYKAQGLDWFAGMAPSGKAELRAAVMGRQALADVLAGSDYDPEMFTPADHAALKGKWSWLLDVVRPALDNGPGPMIDDDLALVGDWGFKPQDLASRVLYLQGEEDRIGPVAHAKWLAAHTPGSELWIRRGEGHISILDSAPAALEWLREHTTQ